MNQAVEARALGAVDFRPLEGGMRQGNFISPEGDHLLSEAADLLRRQMKLTLKVKHTTARRALIDAFFAGIEKIKAGKEITEQSIIAGAKRRLADSPRDGGLYVFPIVFAPQAKKTSFYIGAMRIVAKDVFLEEQKDALARCAEAPQSSWSARAVKDWRAHLEIYDHLVTVDMQGFEAEMAWAAARDGVEFFLNLVRMLFRFSHTRNIRVGGGFVWETKRSSMVIAPGGDLRFTTAHGPWASHLKDSWARYFNRQLRNYRVLLASFGNWLVDGEHGEDPSFERLSFANRLIAEAYCEPHDPIRLVRLVSALETLSLLDGPDKAHQLARRCACVGGAGNPERALEIYDAVRAAYHWRNAVVHGDAPRGTNVQGAFHQLERHLLEIYIGYLMFFARLNTPKPIQSLPALRRAFKSRIDLFYWDPYLV